VLASRRPRHPAGWLLLTPTGSLPSPRWRWWARGMAAVPAVLVLVVTFADGPLDPRYQALGGPFDLRGLGGALLVANQVALALTTLAVMVAAGSLVGRFRRAIGLERLQLRRVALAALVVALAGGRPGGRGPGGTALVSWAVGVCVAILPLATGAAILRYRLYDLDRIISRTLAYGLLTLLLGLGYAAVVLGLGRLLPQGSSLVVAGPPWPRRRCSSRPAAASSRWSTGASTAAATMPPGPSRRSASGCATRSTWTACAASCWGWSRTPMQPTRVSLWLRQPQAPVSS
jgi:hypothetical protein